MTARKIYVSILALVGWIALVAQLVLQLQHSPVPFAAALLRFFSYFTILTNLIVTIWMTIMVFHSRTADVSFFSKPSVQTAITLYIVVVGLVYNIILRSLWITEGLQSLLHDVLHVAIPIATLLYWWIWTKGNNLGWKMISSWLIYPAFYAVSILVHGKFVHWYPYPFLDIDRFGLTKVLENSAMLVCCFLAFAFIFVFAGRNKNTFY